MTNANTADVITCKVWGTLTTLATLATLAALLAYQRMILKFVLEYIFEKYEHFVRVILGAFS
jgi:hypothetical protein